MPVNGNLRRLEVLCIRFLPSAAETTLLVAPGAASLVRRWLSCPVAARSAQISSENAVRSFFFAIGALVGVNSRSPNMRDVPGHVWPPGP